MIQNNKLKLLFIKIKLNSFNLINRGDTSSLEISLIFSIEKRVLLLQ
jgi:hypothetical protein